MNTVVERDIMHVRWIMRASIVQCAPETMLIEYWRARLDALSDTPCLTEHQRCTVMALSQELTELERSFLRTGGRIRNAAECTRE